MWVDSLLRATNQPLSALTDALFETSELIAIWYPVSNQLENLFSLAELKMWELLSWSDGTSVPHHRRAWGEEKDERKPTLHSLHRIFTGELVTSSQVHYFYFFPHLFAMKSWNHMPWSSFFECWVLSQHFHSPLSPSSRGFFPSLSALRVVSSAYVRLLIFLPSILIPACASSSPAFHSSTLHTN